MFCLLKMFFYSNTDSSLAHPASDWHDGGPWRRHGLPVQPGCQRQPRDSARTRDLRRVHLLQTGSECRPALRASGEDGGGGARLGSRAGLQVPQVIHHHRFIPGGRVPKSPQLANQNKGVWDKTVDFKVQLYQISFLTKEKIYTKGRTRQ